MKKLICLLLALVLLGLMGCGQPAQTTGEGGESKESGTEHDAAELLAGYAKVDITPKAPLPLGGYGNSLNRISNGLLDYIYVTALALEDAQGNAMVLLGIDMGNTSGALIQNTRARISEKTGIPEERVVLSASHMHSFPDLDADYAGVGAYSNELSKALIQAAVEAVEDLAPAKMEINTVQTEGLNFVRRYELEGGVFVGYESDITESGLAVVGHETEADRSLQLLKLLREGDKKDILLANFQVHPHRGAGSSSTQITADLVGAFRTEVENKLDCHVIYITGASGNLNPYSAIPEENITSNYKEQGIALAQYAIEADSTYTPVESGSLGSTTQLFDGEIDHSLDHMVNIAQEALSYYQQTNSVAAMREKYLSQGINSPNHAKMIVNRSSKWEAPFSIWAIGVGDIGFAIVPYEMFDTQGVFIKENSPFAMTIVTTCANGGFGYMPSQLACEHGGYEADNTYFEPGSAEKLADMYVEMLNELYTK